MIDAQLLLVVGFICAAAWFFLSRNSQSVQAWKKIVFIVFVFLSIGAVLSPSSTTVLANKLGIGRGADLVLYIFVLAFIFLVVNLQIHRREDRQKITQLARKIAILEASQKDKK